MTIPDDLSHPEPSRAGTPLVPPSHPQVPPGDFDDDQSVFDVAPRHSIADREVPVPITPVTSLLDQWLDGDSPVAVMSGVPGGEDTVDLWNKINDEAEILRSRTTPLYVHKRIMDALPEDTYRRSEPWFKRSLTITPVTLFAAAAVLLAVGAVIARLALR